jgi:hypothetical protein
VVFRRISVAEEVSDGTRAITGPDFGFCFG